MKRVLLPILVMLGLTGCVLKPDSASSALEAYYRTLPDTVLPDAGPGQPLPSEQSVVTEILVGSCFNEEAEASEVMQLIAREEADLFLMLGDNVYGDMDGRAYINNDPDLKELRQSFADLAARRDFQSVRATTPMMVAWDDHDYGANDSGAGFAFKTLAERIHEHFWGLSDQDAGQRPGTYYARHFGPEGQRVQVIMLDTRFFRSDLKPTDAWGASGKERYISAPDNMHQDMLGPAQWAWLEAELSQPADIRLIVSSVQIMPSIHGWEAWSQLPRERQRLFDLIEQTGAKGVVFVSGDRHTAFLYQQENMLPYTAHELTSSSLNMSFASQTSEQDERQIGAGYSPVNYGALEIDWSGRTLTMDIRDDQGLTVRQNKISFAALGYP